MNIKLICSDENRDTVNTILNANGIGVSDSAKLHMVEKGLIREVNSKAMIVFSVETLSKLIDQVKQFAYETKPISMIIGKHNEAYHPIDVKDIVFINAINNNVYINDINKKSYLIKWKLYQLEHMLPDCFIRINKSEIVNIKRIEMIVPMFKGKLIIRTEGYKNPLDISRNYTKAFKERLGL